MNSLPYSRFPDLGKLSLALIENAVAPVLGKETIQVIKGPYSNRQLYEKLCEILAEAERRFYEQSTNKRIASGLAQLKLSDLESVRKFFWEFVENPARPDFSNALETQFRSDYPTLAENIRREAVNLYIQILQDEIIVLDSNTREKLCVVALKNIATGVSQIAANTGRMVNQLDELLNKQTNNLDSTTIESSETKRITIPITLSPLPRNRGFFGREAELRNIEKAFTKSPVVLIEGLAGIGKSSLAIKYLRENIKDLQNVFWIECLDGTTLEDLLVAFSDYARRNSDQDIARAVDTERPNIDQIHNLIRVLEDRSGVICLDSFERTNERSMMLFLHEILDHAQNVKVIVCTRERPKSFIGILSDLTEIPLHGLQIEDSVVFLKSEIQKALSPQIKLDVTYEEIAQKTEGHPFAIKLFIPLVTVYGLSAKKLLYDSADYGLTLEENWLSEIFERLSTEERELLERFSIYEEPIKHEGVKYVFPDENWSAWLQKVQSKFLIAVDHEDFYTHSLIREFCIRKLEATNKIQETASGAAKYYLRNQNIGYYQKEQTQEQIDAKLRAHHYLIMAGDYFQAAMIVWNIQTRLMEWSRNKLLRELIDLTFDTMSSVDLTDDQTFKWHNDYSVWLTYYNASLLFAEKRLDESLEKFKDLFQISEYVLSATNDEKHQTAMKNLRAETVLRICNIYVERDMYSSVMDILDEHHSLFGTGGDKYERMLEKRGIALSRTGEFEKAEAVFKRVLEWRDADRNKTGGSLAFRELATIYMMRNELENAIAYANLGYELAKDTDNLLVQALSLKVLGDVYRKSDNAQNAIRFYEEAFNIFADIENKLELQKTGDILMQLFTENNLQDQISKVQTALDKLQSKTQDQL